MARVEGSWMTQTRKSLVPFFAYKSLNAYHAWCTREMNYMMKILYFLLIQLGCGSKGSYPKKKNVGVKKTENVSDCPFVIWTISCSLLFFVSFVILIDFCWCLFSIQISCSLLFSFFFCSFDWSSLMLLVSYSDSGAPYQNGSPRFEGWAKFFNGWCHQRAENIWRSYGI